MLRTASRLIPTAKAYTLITTPSKEDPRTSIDLNPFTRVTLDETNPTTVIEENNSSIRLLTLGKIKSFPRVNRTRVFNKTLKAGDVIETSSGKKFTLLALASYQDA